MVDISTNGTSYTIPSSGVLRINGKDNNDMKIIKINNTIFVGDNNTGGKIVPVFQNFIIDVVSGVGEVQYYPYSF